MRFLFLSPGYHPEVLGGPCRFASELAQHLSTRGHEVHVITCHPDGQLGDVELRKGVRIYRFTDPGEHPLQNHAAVNRESRYRLRQLLHVSNIATLLVSHHPYFIPTLRSHDHVTFFHAPWDSSRLAGGKLNDGSFLQTVRNGWRRRRMHRIEGSSLRAAKRLFVPTRTARTCLEQSHTALSTDLRTTGVGVDIQRFKPVLDRAALRSALGLQPADLVFLCVRYLDAESGVSGLMDSFRTIAQLHPNAQLWIAGRGPLEDSLREKARASGLGNRLQVLGFVPERDLPTRYAAADILIIPPSARTTFSMAIPEAMACGTPVIATRTEDTASAVGEFSNRLLLAPGDDSLAMLIGGILSGGCPLPARDAIARHARTYFSWDRATTEMEDAWHEFAVPPDIPKRK